tara:strand:+ start:122 stop:874 length:753 start_codon:yes stop_codon:yes gene_type:complete
VTENSEIQTLREPLDVLAVMAHPDDAELLCGGTLIKSTRQAHRVGVIDLTAGEMGSSGSATIRGKEADHAAEIMGLVERRCLGMPDANLENNRESRNLLIKHLRALRPRVVITHWPVGRHPDHRIAAELVRDACFLSALKKLDIEGEPFRPIKLVYATAFREDASPPDFVVDITDHVDRKLEAISAYSSQFYGATKGGEILPGGERPLTEQIRMQLAHYGSLIRVPYGEPFRISEALEVEDLTKLSVSTF